VPGVAGPLAIIRRRVSTLRLEILAVRYRMSNGLRQAMRLWTGILVAWVVAAALDDAPPLLLWGRQWGASAHRWLIAFSIVGGLGIALRPILRHALRRFGQEPMEALPLSAWQRLPIDGAAVALFMAPPLIVLSVVAISGGAGVPAIVAIAGGLAVQTATLGRPQATELRTTPPGPALLRIPIDLRWLLRTGRFGGSELGAVACVLGARLAIANNGVTSPMAMTRIEGLFGALAAAILAGAVTRARHTARHHRALETTLPIPSARRLSLLCASALPFAIPLLLTRRGMPFSSCLYVLLVLFGEHRALREHHAVGDVGRAGVAAAILSAVDARLALSATVLLLPLVWRLALHSEKLCDVPLSQTDEEP
jgi:hypothetical protein